MTGFVIDTAGLPIPEVEVALVAAGAILREVVTDTDGRFTLGNFAAGGLTMRIRRLGYGDLT